ncbi:Uncharacterised protein [Staphylococcus aureus]|nr:Uncharacterised protein [Staphylococcus aureus]SCT74591.1 Uncharacterised protein [Staphylococcus aureus]
MTNKIIANTFKITKIFSIRAASDIPRDSNNAVNKITIAAIISIKPPFVPNGFDNAAGNSMPIGFTSPRKFAENPDATKATAIKYSANRAQPATHPKNSPNNTLTQE